MESKWYLSPGQTLENTRIEDRGHALHVSKNAWGKITAHLDRNRLIQEAIEKEQSHRMAMKEGSEAMTKNWDNSVENIRKRKEEERTQRLAKEQEEKMQKFFELRTEQEAIRQKFIDDERKAIYISKGHPKSLNSALIQAGVMFEREKQLELEQVIKEQEREEIVKYALAVKENAQQEKREKLEKEQKLLEKKLKLREVYLNEIKKKEDTTKSEREERIAKEKVDNTNAEKESEEIKRIEAEEARETKAAKKKEFHDFYEQQRKTKEQLETEDKEQELVIEIYTQAKHRMDCLRKKKEKEMQDALVLRREAAAKQAVAEAKAKGDEEERIMKKAIEEREQEQIEKLQAKEAHRQRLIEEKEEDRQRFLQQEEKRKTKEMEWEKWQMLNRFKQDDVIKEYENNKKIKQWKDILRYRKELFDQMAEDDEIRKEEKKEDLMLFEHSKAKLAEEDEKFFKYAAEVVDYARKKGWTTDPIERVILEYKKENNLPYTIRKPCENYEKKLANGNNRH